MHLHPWLRHASAALVIASALIGIGQTIPSGAAPQPAISGDMRALGQSFSITCTPTLTGAFDPIVMPGMTGMSHLHQFFGSRTITANSTTTSLRDSATSCSDPGDSSGYWVPALKRGTATTAPTNIQVIYTKTVRAAVSAHPRGMVLIAGDARATAAQSTAIAAWMCGSSGSRSTTPQICAPGVPLVASIRFPECWDGKNLDSSTHKSHVSYAVAGACKAGTVALPQLELRISYPRQSSVSGLSLASGSLFSLHADFMNGWRQRGFDEKVKRLNEVMG